MVQTATAPTAAPENPTAIFDTAISDAERLLELFDKLSKPEQQANEVLKRAALAMTLTAWETFIESWLKIQMGENIAMHKVRSFSKDTWNNHAQYNINFKAP